MGEASLREAFGVCNHDYTRSTTSTIWKVKGDVATSILAMAVWCRKCGNTEFTTLEDGPDDHIEPAG